MRKSNFGGLSPMDINAYIMSAEENFSGVDGEMLDLDYGFNANNLDLGFDGYSANGNRGRIAVPQSYQGGGLNYNPYAGYSNAAGMVMESVQTVGRPAAPIVAAKQPTPYQVNVVNTTPNPLTVVLFGMNTYLLTPNFGSSVGVIISPAQNNVSYLELLQQSASQPFETSLIRIQTNVASQLTQILTVTSKDANGQLCQIPIITQSYFSANQFQSTILDVPYPVKIDGNTNISFTILGNTTATYTFFPAEKINSSRIIGGQSAQQLYAAPAVAMATPMFTASPLALGQNVAQIPSVNR